jgi:hypothetical protein
MGGGPGRCPRRVAYEYRGYPAIVTLETPGLGGLPIMILRAGNSTAKFALQNREPSPCALPAWGEVGKGAWSN